MQFFLFGMWSALYAYTPELYPTRASDGCRMCFGDRPGGCVDRTLSCGRCAALFEPARCICPRCRVVCRCCGSSLDPGQRNTPSKLEEIARYGSAVDQTGQLDPLRI